MSRKSKVTIAKEKLDIISDCPDDIFDSLGADDELFEKINAAENGDLVALSELSELLFSTYANDKNTKKSVGYFLKMGVDRDDITSAKNLIAYAAEKNECLDYVDKALSVLSLTEAAELDEVAKCAVFKSIIYSAIVSTDYEELKERLRLLGHPGLAYAELYVTYKSIEQIGSYDEDYVRELLKDAALPPILELPSFSGGKKITPKEIKDGWSESLIRALHTCSLDVWQDFWLRSIYEYCIIYLGGDFTDFAEDIAVALENRRFSPRAKLHALAFIEYTRNNTPVSSDKHRRLSEWYNATSEECVLDGTLNNLGEKEALSALMKEAAYTSEYTAKMRAEEEMVSSTPINHVKNRYTLDCILSNHAKRGNRHMWETALSIRSEDGEIPQFSNITISERYNTVNRGGRELMHDKKRSQIICNGVITIGEKRSPFVLDLILDISYVSTTKCENIELRIKKTQRLGTKLVMSCQIFAE